MNPTSGAFTMPCLSQAGLLGYTPSPQHAFQGDAAHQAQRRTWLTPKDSPGTWYARRDYRSRWTLRPFHRTVFTAHPWTSLPHSSGAMRSAMTHAIPSCDGMCHCQQSVIPTVSPTTAVTGAASALRAPASGVTPDAFTNNL